MISPFAIVILNVQEYQSQAEEDTETRNSDLTRMKVKVTTSGKLPRPTCVVAGDERNLDWIVEQRN